MQLFHIKSSKSWKTFLINKFKKDKSFGNEPVEFSMSLCDPVSVLERINKNIIAEVMDNLKKKDKDMPTDFLQNWKKFIFEDYFLFIFEIAEKSYFRNVTINRKNIVSFKRFSDPSKISKAIKEKKILVSLYKAPPWFAKTYHQLNDEEKSDPDLSDYLFICYNPTEADGKKVTVSMHIMKKPNDVLEAELDYKKPITKRTFIGASIAVVSLFLTLNNYIDFGINFLNQLNQFIQLIELGPILLIIGLVYIISDLKNIASNFLNGSINKLVTKHKKTMRRRLNSTHTLVFLESFNRRIDATIAVHILLIIKGNPDSIYLNDTALLRMIQTNLHNSISNYEISKVLEKLSIKGFIQIHEDLHISLNIADEYLSDKRLLDQKLYEDFDLPEEMQTELYGLYARFRNLVNHICSLASLNPPLFPEC